jgi:hypothetical protein
MKVMGISDNVEKSIHIIDHWWEFHSTNEFDTYI